MKQINIYIYLLYNLIIFQVVINVFKKMYYLNEKQIFDIIILSAYMNNIKNFQIFCCEKYSFLLWHYYFDHFEL